MQQQAAALLLSLAEWPACALAEAIRVANI